MAMALLAFAAFLHCDELVKLRCCDVLFSGVGSGGAGGLAPRHEVYNDDLLYTVVLYVRVHSILVNRLHVLNMLKLVNRT